MVTVTIVLNNPHKASEHTGEITTDGEIHDAQANRVSSCARFSPAQRTGYGCTFARGVIHSSRRESHEMDERDERFSCVSRPFATFVFQTASDTSISAGPGVSGGFVSGPHPRPFPREAGEGCPKGGEGAESEVRQDERAQTTLAHHLRDPAACARTAATYVNGNDATHRIA